MKVLNLNLWNQNYYWERRLPLVVNLIKEKGFTQEPDDIIFFHEVSNTKDHIQIAEINKHLGYKTSLFFEAKRDNQSGRIDGMGLLTNLDVIDYQVIPLSQDISDPDDCYPRMLVLVHVKSPRGHFVLAATHFAISFDAQVSNARECIENINGFNINDFPVIMCADFNCGPKEFPVNIFRAEEYSDLWTELDNKEKVSWPINRELIIRNHRLKYNADLTWEIEPRRIDYIMTKKVNAQTIEMISKKEDNLWHSDHYGVLAELQLGDISDCRFLLTN